MRLQSDVADPVMTCYRALALLAALPPAGALELQAKLHARTVAQISALPSLAIIPSLLRRPLAELAVRKGLPIIDQDQALRDQLVAGRTSHPLFVDRFSASLDEALDLQLLSPAQQTALCRAVASVLLVDPEVATQELVEGTLVPQALAIGPALSSPEERRNLATAINEAIDLPVLDEAQEQLLFEGLVDSLAELVDAVLPVELRDVVIRGNSIELQAVRQQLIGSLQPQIARRLPMGLLVTLVAKGADEQGDLTEAVAVAVVDACLRAIRDHRPDEVIGADCRRERLDARVESLRGEKARVQAEAEALVASIDEQLEALEAERERCDVE